ncbi:MAG: hypothetical protein LBU61_04135 [Coriobacteriales bacterium]|jgi:hypothetical protein|nr:hypothetical protein [Coriobacteriales bacterium]
MRIKNRNVTSPQTLTILHGINASGQRSAAKHGQRHVAGIHASTSIRRFCGTKPHIVWTEPCGGWLKHVMAEEVIMTMEVNRSATVLALALSESVRFSTSNVNQATSIASIVSKPRVP